MLSLEQTLTDVFPGQSEVQLSQTIPVPLNTICILLQVSVLCLQPRIVAGTHWRFFPGHFEEHVSETFFSGTPPRHKKLKSSVFIYVYTGGAGGWGGG